MAKAARGAGRRPDKQDAILRRLRQQIVDGRYPPGSRLPLRPVLQQRFRASTATVQSALSRLIAASFVEARGRRGTFVVEHPPHLSCYALALPPVAGAVQSRLCAGLLEVLQHAAPDPRRRLVVYPDIIGHADSAADQHLAADVEQQRLAGVIYALFAPEQLAGSLLLLGQTPAVLINTHGPASVPRLAPDMDAFVDLALTRLQALGRQRVALLTVTGTQPAQVARFTEAVKQRGLHTAARWMQCVGWPEVHWASHAVQAMLQGTRHTRPDALIILDDNVTTPALAGLAATGLRVGRELDVVAHCNFPCPRPQVPLLQLGFALPELLTAAVACLERQRCRRRVPAVQRILPRFGSTD